MRRAVAVAFAVLALGLAVLPWAAPDLARGVAGMAPLGQPPAIDELPPPLDESVDEFFAERDRVVLTVTERTTVGDFLRRNNVALEHVRRAVADQLGVDPLPDHHVLQPGLSFEIELNPKQEAVP